MSAILYRCPTRSDWLCPCGRVARELRRQGIGYQQIRVPWRRALRGEVQALTGQTVVPVLVLDGEPICDSARIVPHLRWRAEGSP